MGHYDDVNNRTHGFLFDHGLFATIDVPDASFTHPNAINLRGQIVGELITASGTIRGFLFDKGDFTTIEVPESVATIAAGINTRGHIVGQFNTVDHPRERGFLATPAKKSSGEERE